MTDVELTAAEAAGADLPDARDVRVVLADGELVGYGAGRTVRVAAADVRTLVWLDQARTHSLLRSGNGPLAFTRDLLGLVVVMGDAGPLLAFHVHDLAAIHAGDGRSHLRSSGVEELAEALGVVVEGPTGPLDRATVSSVLVGHRTWHARKALATPLVVASGVAGFAAGPGADEWWGPAALVAAVVLAAVVVGWLLVAQAALQRAAAQAPPPEDRVSFPADPASPLTSRLQLGGSTVVAWAGWRLSRRRGPLRRGGIGRCRIGRTHTAFLDDRGGAQLVFETGELLPDEATVTALTEACEQVGIRVDRDPGGDEDAGALALRAQPWTFDRTQGPDHGLDPLEDAAVSRLAPALLVVALAAQALGGIALAADGHVVGWLGLAGTALVAVALLVCHLRFTSLRRRTTQANPRQVAAPRVDWWRSRVGGPGGGQVVLQQSPEERA